MKLSKASVVSGLIGLLVVIGLPVAGHLARRIPEDRCALDGATIDPVYRVEIVDSEGHPHAFCCLRCAQLWLRRQETPPQKITVTDEESGEPLDAKAAWYVRSQRVTQRATGNRIHVFRDEANAVEHAVANSGTVLLDDENPFR
ncbi:MAG: hypothetical protein HYS12_14905 [Planctomycetes bacterium]|nr:hypothetical protein [Planctomycetota bacterium]